MSESLCDRCRDPGACCRRFPLSVWFWDHMPITQQWHEMRERQGLWQGRPIPFVPIEPDRRWPDRRKAGMSQWLFRCEALGSDGRCTIYSVRPDAPCKLYLPAEDQMCAMFSTPEVILERYRRRKAERKAVIKRPLHD